MKTLTLVNFLKKKKQNHKQTEIVVLDVVEQEANFELLIQTIEL